MQFVPEDGIYVYFRYNGKKTVMIVMNSNDKEKALSTPRFAERILKSTLAVNVLNGETINIANAVTIPATTTLVLELK